MLLLSAGYWRCAGNDFRNQQQQNQKIKQEYIYDQLCKSVKCAGNIFLQERRTKAVKRNAQVHRPVEGCWPLVYAGGALEMMS